MVSGLEARFNQSQVMIIYEFTANKTCNTLQIYDNYKEKAVEVKTSGLFMLLARSFPNFNYF